MDDLLSKAKSILGNIPATTVNMAQQLQHGAQQIGDLSNMNAPVFGGLRQISAALNGGKLPDYTNSQLSMAQRMNDLTNRMSPVLDTGIVGGDVAASKFGNALRESGLTQEDKNIAFAKQLLKDKQTYKGLNNNMLDTGANLVPNPSNARQLIPAANGEQAGLYDTPYFHTTSVENAKNIEQNGFTAQAGRSATASHGDMQKGIFLYPNDKGAAQEFGKNFKNPTVLETRIKGKVYDANTETKYGWEDDLQTQEIASNPKILEQLRKDGYVGVTSTELGTPATFVFDPKAIKVNNLASELTKSGYLPEAQVNNSHLPQQPIGETAGGKK